MTTLSEKIRAFMLENEPELVAYSEHGAMEDILSRVDALDRDEDEDRGQMARTIAEVRYENREM